MSTSETPREDGGPADAGEEAPAPAEVVAQGSLEELKRMSATLAEAAVPARIVPPPPDIPLPPGRLLLIVPEGRGRDAEAALDALWRESVGDEGHAASQRVANFDDDVAECPACGETFATTQHRCPECGLNFGPLDE